MYFVFISSFIIRLLLIKQLQGLRRRDVAPEEAPEAEAGAPTA